MISSRLGPKGRLTVPVEVREALGAGPGDTLAYRIENGAVLVRKAGNDENDAFGDAEIQAAIDDLLSDPRPSAPADKVFARLDARIDEMFRDRNAA